MKGIIRVLALCLALPALSIATGCDKEDICDEAEGRCVECGVDTASCQTTIDACRILPDLPGSGRDTCCRAELTSIESSCP